MIETPLDSKSARARCTRPPSSACSARAVECRYVQPSRRPATAATATTRSGSASTISSRWSSSRLPSMCRTSTSTRSGRSGSTSRATKSASRKTTGSRRRSARGAWAGRSCSTGWRSRSSRTSSRPAASTSRRCRPRSRTGSSASRCSRAQVVGLRHRMGRRLRLWRVRKQDESEFSKYYFETADVALHWKLLDAYEAKPALSRREARPAGVRLTLKCSHVFNTLDARGAVS